MDERYPIGKFKLDGEVTTSLIEGWIKEIEELPSLLSDTVKNLTQEQLDTPYRSGGWTVRQVVHHVADSHMNAYVRFKLALTEDNPTIKPYEEAKWAELPDYQLPVEVSLTLIETMHARWVKFLKRLSPEDLKRTFIHPESGTVSVGENIGIYAWHGKHHFAHITSLLTRKGWSKKGIVNPPILNRIGTVFIPVRDIKKARDWYCDLLGVAADGEVQFGHLYVIPMEGPGIVLDSKIFREDQVFNHPVFHINTENIEEAYNYLKEKNIEITTEIQHGHYFNFKDPDGNQLMVCKC